MSDIDPGQLAIRALAEVRRFIVGYRVDADGADDLRTNHARTGPIGDVVNELLVDLHNMDVLAGAAGADAERAIQRAEKAEENLAESKRPFTAQMEMQNLRIIALNAEVTRLEALLQTPEVENFLEGARREAAHQVERWGEAHDRSKSAENWFWLVGYLAGKALRASITGDRQKALHHTISAAGALFNWHKAIKRDESGVGVGRDEDLKTIEAQS